MHASPEISALPASPVSSASFAPAARGHRRAFTLIELLTVIAIIGVLAAITMAAVGKVRSSAHAAKCGSNVRQLAVMASVMAQENGGWVPQACWAWKPALLPSYMRAINLRGFGYTDQVGTCGAVNDGVTYPPHYGLNSHLASIQDPYYYQRGKFPLSKVLTSRTILFTETKWVSGWGFNATQVTDAAPAGGGRTAAYFAANVTFDPRHGGKGYVAYADAHIGLRTAAELAATNPDPWRQGIFQ